MKSAMITGSALFILPLLFMAVPVLADNTCYPPAQGDPNYDHEFIAYNACVEEQNAENCEDHSTDSMIFTWDIENAECNMKCTSGYYRDIKGDCDPEGVSTAAPTPEPTSTSATTTTIIQTVYVPIPATTTPLPTKVITVIKTVPATTTGAATVSASVPVEDVVPTPAPTLWSKVWAFFSSLL